MSKRFRCSETELMKQNAITGTALELACQELEALTETCPGDRGIFEVCGTGKHKCQEESAECWKRLFTFRAETFHKEML